MAKENAFEKYKREIRVTDLAIHYGYLELKDKTTKKWPYLFNPAFDDKILIPGDKDGFKWQEVNGLKNEDIVTFIISRLDTVFAKWNQPNKFAAAENCLSDYMGLGEIEKERNSLGSISKSEIDAERKPYNPSDNLLRPLTDKFYLIKTREISPDILKDPRFADKIFNFQYLDSEGKSSSFKKTAFPITNSISNPVHIGMSLRDGGDYPKLFAPGTNRSTGVWMSNPVGEIKKIHLLESELDALSHYELYKETAQFSLYISTGGQLTNGQIETVKLITEELKERNQLSSDFKYVLNFDNNTAGSSYDTRFIQHIRTELSEPFTQISLGKNSQIARFIFFNTPDTSKETKKLISALHSVNNQYDKYYSTPSNKAKRKYDAVFDIVTDKNETSITFPKQTKIFERFNRALLQSLGKHTNIVIEKSKMGDFNDDLKEKNKINRTLNEKPDQAYDQLKKKANVVNLDFNNKAKTAKTKYKL